MTKINTGDAVRASRPKRHQISLGTAVLLVAFLAGSGLALAEEPSATRTWNPNGGDHCLKTTATTNHGAPRVVEYSSPLVPPDNFYNGEHFGSVRWVKDHNVIIIGGQVECFTPSNTDPGNLAVKVQVFKLTSAGPVLCVNHPWVTNAESAYELKVSIVPSGPYSYTNVTPGSDFPGPNSICGGDAHYKTQVFGRVWTGSRWDPAENPCNKGQTSGCLRDPAITPEWHHFIATQCHVTPQQPGCQVGEP